MNYVLEFFQTLCFGNFALGIFLFTVVINVILSPTNIKQQKSMAKQARLRPKMEELKEKYGDDRMKYSTAVNELNQQEGVNPMGGCLPMLLKMIVLLFVYNGVLQIVNSGEKGSGFSLFGLDLLETPKFNIDIINHWQPIWIIPILCFLASFGSTIISNINQKHINPDMANQGGSMKLMLFIMPVFSLIIAFGVPGAVGFYWICSNIVNTAIQLVVSNIYSADKIIAKETAESGIKRRKYEREKMKQGE